MEHKFTQSNDLIKMVITRQAGDYRKGILEVVQNAYSITKLKYVLKSVWEKGLYINYYYRVLGGIYE